MKILTIHSDFIEFEPVSKAIASAEEVEKFKKKIDNCLVVFSSVEKGDEKDWQGTAKKAVEEIEDIAGQVKENRIVVYPFVHLSNTPSSPDVALKVVKEVEKLLKEKKYDTYRAPFGWYKAFNIQCKGHPLAELSRTFGPAEKEKEIVSESLKAESNVVRKFYIMTPNGELKETADFDYSGNDGLKKLVDYELKKVRAYPHEPPHIAIMKSHGLVNYEPASDPGHFRWLPKGMVMKKTIERMIIDLCKDMGAMEVETPIMYDMKHPTLEKYLHRFPARQYVVQSEDKELFLRFAACFGQFLAMRDMTISYSHLPLRMIELTKYSFRREQSGELVGLKRLRAFTMPDMHTLCATIATAKKEFEKQFEKSVEWNRTLGLEFETVFRAEKDFFEKNKDWYLRMAKLTGKPMMLEIFDKRYAYFITKFEFNYIDTMDKASALSTVQIDIENAETYDINYVDKDGKKKHPVILHASISGSTDRVVYALLEDAAAKIKRNEIPSFPIFLSPTQVRLIPFSTDTKEHLKYVTKLAKKLVRTKIRADIDDRNETLSKRVRDAETDWIPYIIVVGDREIKEGNLAVRKRGSKEQQTMNVKSLVKEIKTQIKAHPFEPLSLPMLLSKRPIM